MKEQKYKSSKSPLSNLFIWQVFKSLASQNSERDVGSGGGKGGCFKLALNRGMGNAIGSVRFTLVIISGIW